MERLWSDARIKQETNIEDPRRGNLVAILKRMRDEYEARITDIENWCRSAMAVIEIGVELMPSEQIAQWTAVRAVCESCPVEWPETNSDAELAAYDYISELRAHIAQLKSTEAGLRIALQSQIYSLELQRDHWAKVAQENADEAMILTAQIKQQEEPDSSPTEKRSLPKADYADKTISGYLRKLLVKLGDVNSSEVDARLQNILGDAINEAINVAVREALSAIPNNILE